MFRTATFTILCLALAVPASAQDTAADIEGGDTSYSAQTSLRAPRSSRGGGGIRIGIQGRLPLAALAWDDGNIGGGGFGGLGNNPFNPGDFDIVNTMVPMVTPGVRLVDGKLWLGLGLGFTSLSGEEGAVDASRSAWSLSPVVAYDLLSDDSAALSLGGAINMMSLGETEVCNNGCQDANDDAFGLGLNLTAGVRGKLSEGLSLGAEFGWGLLSVGWDAGGDYVVHGFIAALKLEASVGI